MTTGLVSWLRFSVVGIFGACVHLTTLTILRRGFNMNIQTATVLAVECAVLHNFIWHECWTWAHRELDIRTVFGRLLRFNASNGLISISGNMVFMWLFFTRLHLHYLVAAIGAIGACALLNFFVSDRLVFRQMHS